MERIKDTLNNVLKDVEQKRKKARGAEQIQALLGKILTPRQLRHIKFHSFYRGNLTIDVDSSAWVYELNLHKEDYLRKLNTKIARLEKKGLIKDIRFRLGEISG